MRILIGFAVALLVGLTGVGGGSFTTPALVLVAGLSGAEAVGTALVFSTIVRLTAAPFYVAGKHIHLRYLWLMLLGALPGLLCGTYLLASFNSRRWNPVILVIIGAILIVSSLLTFIYRNARPSTRADAPAWLPWLTLPIGVETGFSSAGAGALGTILLFNCSDMPAAKVVGTDLVFGIVLAATGSLLHFGLGSVSAPALKALLLGGIPGVLAGCALAPRVPSRRLRPAIIVVTLLLGVQLVWSGAHLAH
ncbi:MAG TPA: sulfite exporter TauE/SafE family protein [Candidatus Angelobacter sp.]